MSIPVLWWPASLWNGTQLLLFSIVVLFLAIPTLTYITSSIIFHNSLHYFRDLPSSKTKRPHLPPLLPYYIPVLGHALVFLNTKPGSFHRRMQRHFSANPQVGCISILLAGQRAHIISSADLVIRLFKTRGVSREIFNRDIMVKSNGLGKEDDFKCYEKGISDGITMSKMNEELNTKFLLGQNAVNTLTSKFMETFYKKLREERLDGEKKVPLYLFIRDRMFAASTVALYGTEILKQMPDLNELFWPYENGTLARLFQLGRFAKPEAYNALDVALDKWEQWTKYSLSEGGSKLLDEDWDDLMGARLVRERHQMYENLDLSIRGRAAFDLAFMFGLNSNAIPAAGWTLCHLLQPSNADLLKHVQQEVNKARQSDGTINVSVLMGSTYLNSCFHETMRCYVDVLVTRTLTEDLILDEYLMRKGDIIIAPSYIGHHDSFWNKGDVLEDQWFGERFLNHNEKTGEVTFSTAGTNGRFFPFGGGTYVCPGRVFAKQEVFGAVAAFLAAYDVKFEQYVGVGKAGEVTKKGTDPKLFPPVKQQYSGAGVVIPEGDILVKLARSAD